MNNLQKAQANFENARNLILEAISYQHIDQSINDKLLNESKATFEEFKTICQSKNVTKEMVMNLEDLFVCSKVSMIEVLNSQEMTYAYQQDLAYRANISLNNVEKLLSL
jgi:hypothetical protein